MHWLRSLGHIEAFVLSGKNGQLCDNLFRNFISHQGHLTDLNNPQVIYEIIPLKWETYCSILCRSSPSYFDSGNAA